MNKLHKSLFIPLKTPPFTFKLSTEFVFYIATKSYINKFYRCVAIVGTGPDIPRSAIS